MTISKALPMLVLVLLVGGISLYFGQAEPDGPDTPPDEGPLVWLAPVLRARASQGDAQMEAAIVVNRVLDKLPSDPRAPILTALGHEDWGAQWAGLLAVPRYGESDAALADAIARLLDADAPVVRAGAATAAGYLGPEFERLLQGLADLCADEQAAVRAAALGTLAGRSAKYVRLVPVFTLALRDEDPDCRTWAARGLAQIELQERVLPENVKFIRAALVRALADPSPAVRAFAVMALGRAGPAAGPDVPDILPLLRDEDPLVRGQAATALSSIGADALPAIAGALADVEGPDAPPLLWALRLMGEPALPLLGKTLDHPKPLLRVLAAQQLWEMKQETERAVEILIAGLASADRDALLVSIRILGRMGTEGASALPALERLGGHEDDTVASAAAASAERLRAVTQSK